MASYGEAITRGDIIWVKRTLIRSLLVVVLIAGIPSIIFILLGKLIVFLLDRTNSFTKYEFVAWSRHLDSTVV